MSEHAKDFDFVCIGSATQDVFVRSDAARILTLSDHRKAERMLCFEYGGKVSVENIEFTTGGGATNASVSLARLGARAAFVGKVGPDPVGVLILGELQANGVDTAYHLQSQTEPTGYSVILTSYEGDRTVLTHRGASTEITADEIDWAFAERTQWLYLTSLSGTSAALIEPITKRAATAEVRLAFNPGSTQIKAGLDALAPLLRETDVLLLNKEEAAQLTGNEPLKDVIIDDRCTLCEACLKACPMKVLVRDRDRIVPAFLDRCDNCGDCLKACPTNALVSEPWAFNVSESFEVLCKTGPKVVVITDGPRGAQACDGETIHMLPAAKVTVASSLGAGDAFGSAFTFEYARSGDLGRALALGTANAASVVKAVGAKNDLLTAAQAEGLLNDFDASSVRQVALADALAAARQ